MAFDRTKHIARFVEETNEHITDLNKGLLALENDPDDVDTLNGLLRTAHTIKGTSRMLKFIGITEVAHKLETSPIPV